MSHNQDVYRKVGRGGAGNFYPSKQADDAARDIEAQETAAAASSVSPLPSSKAPSSAVSRGGRGGAGNFVDSTAAAQGQENTAEETAAAVSTSVKVNPSQRGPSGRGGAGNWKGSGGSTTAEDEEKGLGGELERKVLDVVDHGLKLPEKAHHATEKKSS